MAARPGAEETRNMEAVTNPLRMQQGGNGGPPPTRPSYLNVWSEELCAQTELCPLRVILGANRWGLGAESLEDAGAEIVQKLKSGIQPKIGYR